MKFNETIEYPTQEVEDKAYCEMVVSKTIEKVEAEGLEIGAGRTANILVSEIDPRICMKAVGNKKISCNDVSKEMAILDILSLKKRRVPKPVCAVTTRNKDYLFMETIGSRLSIEDILKDKSGEVLKRLPLNFNFKKFFELLREEVRLWHEEERIFHRDLHAGNIMIDLDGEPIIVDTGDATIQYFSTEDPYKQINARGEMIRYPKTDEQNVTEIYKTLGEFLSSHNWFK